MVVLCLVLLRFLPLEVGLHAQGVATAPDPVETPQVTAIAVTPLVVQDGQGFATGTFKIIRTGGTANTLYVTYRLGAKTVSGENGLAKDMTEAIGPGKSSANIKIGFPSLGPGLPPQLVFQKLKLVTPTDGSYTVPNSKTVKIYVSYKDS